MNLSGLFDLCFFTHVVIIMEAHFKIYVKNPFLVCPGRVEFFFRLYRVVKDYINSTGVFV